MKTKILLFTLLLFFSGNFLFAQYAGTNMGTEFVFAIPPGAFDAEGTVTIYIAATTKTDVTVKVKDYSSTQQTVANGTIAVRIRQDLAQAYILQGSPMNEQKFNDGAIQVKSGAPVICNILVTTNNMSEAFLALPVSSLGKEYVTSSYYDISSIYPGTTLPSFTTIAAAYDNTKVRFTLGGTQQTRTQGGMIPGQTKEFILNKGDCVIIPSKGDKADLSGSKIISNKPVAVTSGNLCANVPYQTLGCNYIAEMELPMFTWGKEYLSIGNGADYGREIIRVYASESTTCYQNGFNMGTVPSAGHANSFLEFGPMSPTVKISANKPIYVVRYSIIGKRPVQVSTIPVEQFQNEIFFTLPAIGKDSIFSSHQINFICPLTNDNQIPGDIEFAAYDTSKKQFLWNKLTSVFGAYNGSIFSMPSNGKLYTAKTLSVSVPGVYKIRSKSGENKFTAYLYGSGKYNNVYGMPATTGLRDSRDPFPPKVEFVICCCEISGLVTDYPLNPNKDTTRSNIAAIYLDPDSSFNVKLTHDNFVAGEQQKVKWALHSIDTAKDARALIHFVDLAGNLTDTLIHKRGVCFEVDGGLLPPVKRGTPVETVVSIRNIGYDSLTITNVEIEPNSIFTIKNKPAFPLPMTMKNAINIPVAVNTDTVGNFSSNLILFYNNQTSNINLHIIVKEIARISANDLDFGTLLPNAKRTDCFTLENTGGFDLTITGVNGPNTPEFKRISDSDWDFTTPLVLKPGEKKNFCVEFTSSDLANYQDTIRFISDAEEGKSFVALRAKISTTSAEENSSSEIIISPNPANDFVEISFGKILPEKIILLNTLGEKILEEKISGQEKISLDLSRLPQGIYSLQFSGDQNFSKKFILTR